MSGVAPTAPVTPAPAPTSQTQSGTVAAAATPGTVPPTAALAATVVNPPAALARLAVGTLLDGQVLTRDAALQQAIVRTIYGQVTVQLTNPPAEGSRISLQLQAPSGDGRAALVTVDPTGGDAGRGEAAARAPAGQPASGTISNPPATLMRLPPGTTVEGRVVPSDQRGQVTVQTGHGALALRTTTPLPTGARVAIQIQPNPSGVAGLLPAKVSVVALPASAAATNAAEPPAATVALSPGAVSAETGALASPANAAIVAQAPAVKLAPGTVLDGRVVGPDDQGAVVIQTAQGPLALRTPLPLAPGTKVMLQVPPDGGNQVTIVAIDGRPAARAMAGLTIEGRVISTDAQGTTIVQTAQGPLALRSPVPLPPGSAVTLQLPAGAGEQPVVLTIDGRPVAAAAPQLAAQAALTSPAALVNPAEPTLALAREWPALSDAIAALNRADPHGVAAQTLDTAIPRPSQHLAPALAMAIGALREGNLKSWLGDATTDALTKAGRPDLAGRVSDEFGKLARLAEPPPSQQDWRVYLVPFHDGQQLQQIQLFTRRHQQNGGDAEGDDITARFVFDIELTRLGRIQLDGLAGDKRFDLMVRSRTPLTEEMRRHITLLFGAAREEGGFQGEVGFQTVSEFPVEPLEDRAEPTPHGIVV
jgi:hypothetical protein